MDPLAARSRELHRVGVASGLAAGAWLGAAEAPIKLAGLALPPVVVSLAMVWGVFVARWSLPALMRGSASVAAEVRRAPHLVVWGVLAGALWAVANTLTVYAIRDVGLSIAFPLWNANSLLGIVWGVVFFNELRDAGWARWVAVLAGAVVMCGGATLLALASSGESGTARSGRGVAAALTAGALWGTMYIPYRKAYLTGMSPLSFVTFFTIGEVITVTTLAVAGEGMAPLGRELGANRDALFWLFAGGFVWVVGDLFQQYAAKYIGISRGIPLSNTNQLWGLLWGVLVFGELRHSPSGRMAAVIAGSLMMALGAAAIASAATGAEERRRWAAAAEREATRYGLDRGSVEAALGGASLAPRAPRRLVDWAVVGVATAAFLALASWARVPTGRAHWGAAAALASVMVLGLGGTGYLLWRATEFN